MRKLFNDTQINYILDNKDIMTYGEIGKNIGGYTSQQVCGWINNNGYAKSNRSIFSLSDQEYMRTNYRSQKYSDIADKLGFTELQVRGWINGNCESKLRNFDKAYFKDIESPTQTYWLGFIYADGWICHSQKRRSYELGIELQIGDRKHLEKFNNEIGGTHIITTSHKEKLIPGNRNISITDSCILRIYSKQITEDLMRHSILENKTDKPDYPIVNKYFIDFLRGYFDGDGSIYINKDGNVQVHITSAHREIFDYIGNTMSSEYKIKSCIYEETERKFRIYFNGVYAEELLDLFYKDEGCVKLDRKYQKYLLYKQGRLAEKFASNNTGEIGGDLTVNTEVNSQIA